MLIQITFPLFQLTSSMSSLVWATTKEHAQQLLGMSNEQFVDALNEALVCITYFMFLLNYDNGSILIG